MRINQSGQQSRIAEVDQPRASGNRQAVARSLDAILFHEYDRIGDDRPAVNVNHARGADRGYGHCRLAA